MEENVQIRACMYGWRRKLGLIGAGTRIFSALPVIDGAGDV